MRVTRMLYLILCALLVAAPCYAQLRLSVPAAIEKAIERNEPKWNLVFVSIRKTNEENYSYFRWKHDSDEIAVHVNEYESAQRITPESIITAAFRPVVEVKGFGDEAYLLGPAQYLPRRFDIIFRKGKVRVDVEASSEDFARQFAKHCAGALPAN